MRIDDILGNKGLDKRQKRTTKSDSMLNQIFNNALSQHENKTEDTDNEVDSLRIEIEKAGDKLANEPTLNNFKTFRDLISNLAKKINDQAYKLDKIGGTPNNPRYFEIITVINNEADKLYNLIVKEQRDNLAITAKVIGIKGLVVDLIT